MTGNFKKFSQSGHLPTLFSSFLYFDVSFMLWVIIVVAAGSFFRPIGGYLADRVGGMKLLTGLFLLIALAFMGLGQLPPFPVTLLLLIVVMLSLGMGNGAVFQVVPLLFPKQIGVITGLVGACGGIGGFFLPIILGTLKDTFGFFGAGFVTLGGVVAIAFLVALRLRGRIKRLLTSAVEA
ncbi:hypothetical protein DNHGIG_23030 [Collibacillus ludicampi]|uniref:Major facilitator superfamily (MFS) profile domain-containing protein n=1 Tax=Collibacillus ludicampi TaxID=2771369 RepID=A0AAV4LG15_9BACL|nr:MFS transporter [Collibacillus ludicampi]GIM46754.1 hypothetical protein DNHGIG_23030 [Collibacillus ludicampi]